MLFAWRNLVRRRLRTLLSVLGVGVGVGAIVAFTAMGEGFRESVDRYGRESGADLILVEDRAGDPSFGRIASDELDWIRARDDVRAAAGSLVMPVALPDRVTPVLVMGRDPGSDLLSAVRNPALAGRLLESEEEALVGEILAEELDLAPGDTLEVLGRDLTVVGRFRTGVRWENGGLIVAGDVIRSQLGMPAGSAMVGYVYLADESTLPATTLALRERFPRLKVLPSALLTSGFEQLAYIDTFVWLISLAALLVGAIGVLNTMLMNVTERVREIGTLRAFGWRRARVLRLILAEGLLTAVVGGFVGWGLGVLGAEALMSLVPQGMLEAAYPPRVFARALAVALLLGATGALYPAWRASRLSPAEALRYE